MVLDYEKLYALKCSRVKVPEVIDADYIRTRNLNAGNSSLVEQYAWEFCGQDLSKSNIELTLEEFKTLSFDTNTIFSQEQQEKFQPHEILQDGKQFSAELDKLFNTGITGKGIKVGIIDAPFNVDSDEFREKGGKRSRVVFSKDFSPETYCSNEEFYHGKAVTSLLAGSSTGIVPEADIYLFTVGDVSFQEKHECRKNILRYIIANNIKLDVLSMSGSFEYPDEVDDLLEQIKRMGTMFIDSSVFWKDFSYGRKTEQGVELNENLKSMYEQKAYLSPKRQRLLGEASNKIIIPCAGRTHAQIGTGYMYNGTGCASWSIPQVAGLFCVAKQINKNITYDEFVECLKKTANRGENGLNIQLLQAMDAVGRCSKRQSKMMNYDRA